MLKAPPACGRYRKRLRPVAGQYQGTSLVCGAKEAFLNLVATASRRCARPRPTSVAILRKRQAVRLPYNCSVHSLQSSRYGCLYSSNPLHPYNPRFLSLRNFPRNSRLNLAQYISERLKLILERFRRPKKAKTRKGNQVMKSGQTKAQFDCCISRRESANRQGGLFRSDHSDLLQRVSAEPLCVLGCSVDNIYEFTPNGVRKHLRSRGWLGVSPLTRRAICLSRSQPHR